MKFFNGLLLSKTKGFFTINQLLSIKKNLLYYNIKFFVIQKIFIPCTFKFIKPNTKLFLLYYLNYKNSKPLKIISTKCSFKLYFKYLL